MAQVTKSGTVVTEQFLREGAIAALEQCGLLLHDAVALYERGSYATAVSIAAHGREELGRARILDELGERVASGQQITLDDINRACSDHIEKQRRGQLSVVLRDRGTGDLLRAKARTSPGTPEYQEADRQLDDVVQRVQRRRPHERDEERREGVYVDPNDTGTSWKRPRDRFSAEDAWHIVNDLANDYNGRRANVAVTLPDGTQLPVAKRPREWWLDAGPHPK
jgi:AbiV family abortive infection protein